MVNLSFSTIDSYLSCPRKVYFKLQGVKTPSSYALLYGLAWHDILERKFKGEDVNIEQVLRSYFDGSKADKQENWNGDIRQGKKDWSIESTAAWMEGAVAKMMEFETRPQMTELWLEREFPDFKLRGRIDAFWGNGIVDFKLTGGYYDQYKKRNVYDVSFLQGITYAILNLGPVDFRFCIMYKELTPRIEIIDVPEAKDQRYLDWAVADVFTPVAKGIEAGIFPANPNYKWCKEEYCPYWIYCRGRR